MCSESLSSTAAEFQTRNGKQWVTQGYLRISSEFEILKSLNGMEGILLISRSGDVFWSWQDPKIDLNLRTMRLVEMIKNIIPTMLAMPGMGVQRSLFQFDYDSEFISMYFTNIGDAAFVCCILGQKFDYINVTEEVNKTAFILSKKLARVDISPEEMKRKLKEISVRTSQHISSTMNQFSKITKKRSNSNGVK